MNTLKQLPELTALVEAGKNPFNQVLMDYVGQGGKTVGFMYQDTPEEIITAAGAAPIYLRGTASEGTEMAEAFFRQLTCNYTKHTYNEILDGKWDFLDGAVLLAQNQPTVKEKLIDFLTLIDKTKNKLWIKTLIKNLRGK